MEATFALASWGFDFSKSVVIYYGFNDKGLRSVITDNSAIVVTLFCVLSEHRTATLPSTVQKSITPSFFTGFHKHSMSTSCQKLQHYTSAFQPHLVYHTYWRRRWSEKRKCRKRLSSSHIPAQSGGSGWRMKPYFAYNQFVTYISYLSYRTFHTMSSYLDSGTPCRVLARDLISRSSKAWWTLSEINDPRRCFIHHIGVLLSGTRRVISNISILLVNRANSSRFFYSLVMFFIAGYVRKFLIVDICKSRVMYGGEWQLVAKLCSSYEYVWCKSWKHEIYYLWRLIK